MVGGGQLARMTHQAAIALGQSLRVLAVGPAEPAPLVAPDVDLGSHTDLAALRAFAAHCDVVTLDHEQVPTEHLRALVADGVTVHPGPDALIHAQDKLIMRRRLADLGIPVPSFAPVETPADLTAFADVHGWPCVLKAIRGGYDGRGVWIIRSLADALPLIDSGTPLLVEQLVPMRRELAALVARSPFGQGACWPVVETVQVDGICVEVLAPAPDLSPSLADDAQRLALRVASELGVVGVLAVELFDTDGGLVVNELAMRPHNSGHWTIDGAVTSQFEQHIRAVLDYPLGATDPVAPVAVMANVLGAAQPAALPLDERLHHLFARFGHVKVHLYGKAERPGRKIGHVTVLGSNLASVRRTAALAAHWLSAGQWADGYDIHTGERA
jgi:5-(carboxyamino)imidazole ribonucleotide synthase